MSRRSWWIAALGTAVALTGVWGAWVPHRGAALALSGWDLSEFAKFLPGAPATRELFYLPVWCAGLVLALLANQQTNPPREPTKQLAHRVGLLALALALMAALLPPYPQVLNGYQLAEFRWQFILGTGGALVVLATPLSKRLPVQVVGGWLVALALAGAIPALWQFLQVRGAIETSYDASLGWGWGLGVFLAGWGLVGAAGWRLSVKRSTHTPKRLVPNE